MKAAQSIQETGPAIQPQSSKKEWGSARPRAIESSADRNQLQQRRPPEGRDVHPHRGYSTTTLPFMKGWIEQW